MNKVWVVLLLAAAVGTGALVLGVLSANHAFQPQHVTTQSAALSGSPATQSTANPISSIKFPPSLFSSLPCKRCLMAHEGFWS